MGLRVILFAFCLVAPALPALAGDWPAFRGPSGNGISSETNVPVTWSSSENVRWKAKLPAPGNSSPIVFGSHVFVTCATDGGSRRGLYCFARDDGRELWARTVTFEKDMPTHKTNPYCASTPVTDGQCVVVWHGSAGLFCYDFEGTELWSRDLGAFKHMWGYGPSPVIQQDRVILHYGPGRRVMMMALNLETGKTLWKTPEPVEGTGDRNEEGKYMGSWTTPVIADVKGQDLIICAMATRVNAYDPATGKILWSCDGIRGKRGDLAYSSPLISEDFCVTTGGYKGPSIGFRIGGTGNITENRVWRREQNPQNIGSGVFLGDYIYRPNAGPGTIECLEAESGEVQWTDRAGGGTYWGSIIAAEGRLYVTNQDGVTIVFRPNPEKFELIAQNELGEPSNSTPAISDGQVFIRTFKHLFCIGGKASQ